MKFNEDSLVRSFVGLGVLNTVGSGVESGVFADV